MSNLLTYSIARESLEGTIGDQSFRLTAWSGGRRGSTRSSAAEHTYESYDVFRKTAHGKKIHGGPLPPGIYTCEYVPRHKEFGRCIRLHASLTALLAIDAKGRLHFYDRSDFYIHGRGPHGSDGCIVPESEAERRRLNRAVRNASSTVLLQVNEKGMPLPAEVEAGTVIA